MSPWRNLFKRDGLQPQILERHRVQSTTLVNAVYYPNWRVYKDQPPSSLNLDYISHIFYAFAWVREDGSVYLSDEYADAQIRINDQQGCLNDLRSIKVKYPGIKTVLSLGGGGKGSATLAIVAGGEPSRSRCAWTVDELCRTYGFDGVDLDWEHPASPQQGLDYVDLLTCLRQTLPAPRLLTSALPAGTWVLKNIDLRKAIVQLDYINLMTYDFSGPWTSVCGHHAQLYTPKRPHDDASRASCSSAVAYVVSQGVPSSKILLGIPTYGRSFLGAEQPGDKYKGHAGDEGTFEYKDLPRPRAIEGFDGHVGAAFCVGADSGFVSYDNVQSVTMKADFARQQRLGGLFYWTGTGDVHDSRSLIGTGWNTLNNQ